jgi:hypothetical protein
MEPYLYDLAALYILLIGFFLGGVLQKRKASKLSFQISQKTQTDMTYPGQVKVTVIREN